MPTAYARRLCPELVLLGGNYQKYREVSTQIREVFAEYSDIIEPLSLDEAFIDVTDSEHYQDSATRIAEAIRKAIFEATQLTASAGVAPNKFLAKIASDWRKPDGLFVIPPESIALFVQQLPVHKIPGVGKVTARKLHRMGVYTCGDLQVYSLIQMAERFGRYGETLYNRCRGWIIAQLNRRVLVNRSVSKKPMRVISSL